MDWFSMIDQAVLKAQKQKAASMVAETAGDVRRRTQKIESGNGFLRVRHEGYDFGSDEDPDGILSTLRKPGKEYQKHAGSTCAPTPIVESTGKVRPSNYSSPINALEWLGM